MSSANPATHRRRTSHEIRQLLIDAARDVFADRGYNHATTVEITKRAGVSEVLLYRHFGSKAGLFTEAVIRPFDEFFAAFVERWEQQREGDWTPEELIRDFVEHIYDLLETNRDLVFALLAAQAHEPGLLSEVNTTALVNSMLDRLESVASEGARLRHQPVDTAITAHAIIAMVVGTSVFGARIFPMGDLPRERLTNEIVALACYGVLSRPSA